MNVIYVFSEAKPSELEFDTFARVERLNGIQFLDVWSGTNLKFHRLPGYVFELNMCGAA